ncbi:MAG: hypothetical protein FWC69_02760 [Defluviitaleaceae bacterium]|nr:hypothetical protein [Defluviitaleaceae bacterium]
MKEEMKRDKHLGLKINSEMLKKLHYISAYDGRSTTRQVLFLINKAIREFEKEHGKIELQEEKG